MFSDKDITQIEAKGQSVEGVKEQIQHFKNGFPYINLHAPATKENGIVVFTEEEAKEYAQVFDNDSAERSVMKFVPASGAASRMFKLLFSFMEDGINGKLNYTTCFEDKSFNSAYNFFANIEKFPFYSLLTKVMEKDGLNLNDCIANNQHHVVLEYMLTDKGLSYATKPKGLLLFHNYSDDPRYAFEEHLVEAAVYARDNNNIAKLHFTVSPEHMDGFQTAIDFKKTKYEEQYGVRFEITYSIQKPSTDTIAVNTDNTPFREKDGSLLFRPGGHGALIENVNDLNGDIVFIKNIDNVVPDSLKYETFLYKKALAGYLISLESKQIEFMDILEGGNPSEEEINDMVNYGKEMLNLNIDLDIITTMTEIEVVDYLYTIFNRPIRICGMVKNEGEPGGGPFWVSDEDGELSLQIVESSQMDLNNENQKDIVSKATHFNPVDLICSVQNFEGENFDLLDFVDHNTGFISEKSKDGKTLKAQELPGLWNGAMAKWITIFAETPIITFNPVKTVNDLLRDQHQA